MKTFNELKARQRNERQNYPDGFGIRIHRALSWLDRAEQCEDEDGKFIFLWISFNSAYAQALYEYEHTPETQKLYDFLQKIVLLDEDNNLYELLWGEFPKSVRMLLNNKYLFPAFWSHIRGELSEDIFKEQFSRSIKTAEYSLTKSDTANVLKILLSRLYTLRNQIVHGGSTYGGRVNRSQLRDSTKFMSILVPEIIKVMMDNPNTIWGEAIYPVISGI